MGVILDTSLIVAAELGMVRIEALLGTLASEPVGIAAITASELLLGTHRARDAGARVQRAALVDALLETIPVLPFGAAEARRHAGLWADLMRAGTMIGPHDLLIAATALAHGHALATLQHREFSRIHGLSLLSIDRFLS